MPRIVPAAWMPECPVRGIITHWTAGTYQVSELDKEHYHFIIDGEGHLFRGDHSIVDNASTADGVYAAHTRACNQGWIGVSVACMGLAHQSPFYGGKWPLTEHQWDTLAQVCADLAERYQIPVTPTRILGHGEVQKNLGIMQRGKWDPLVLPWNPGLKMSEVGELFRERVRQHLAHAAPTPAEDPVPLEIRLGEQTLVGEHGFLSGGHSWVPVRPVAEYLGGQVLTVQRDAVQVRDRAGQAHPLLFRIVAGTGYVPSRDLVMALGGRVTWDAEKHRLQFFVP